ncbi:MAG: hypothetical protein ACJ8AO_20295 [Gemmatimonadaceae bacterium]
MTQISSLEDLGRAVALGRVGARDQVYVPAELPGRLGEEAWARIQEALRRVGAGVHALPDLASIYVVSFEELCSGAFPPVFPRAE